MLGLDARDGKVAVKGWTAVSETKAIDLLNEVRGLAIGAVIYTDIARDGMLNETESHGVTRSRRPPRPFR